MKTKGMYVGIAVIICATMMLTGCADEKIDANKSAIEKEAVTAQVTAQAETAEKLSDPESGSLVKTEKKTEEANKQTKIQKTTAKIKKDKVTPVKDTAPKKTEFKEVTPKMTRTPEEYDKEFTVEYCRSFYQKNTVMLKNMLESFRKETGYIEIKFDGDKEPKYITRLKCNTGRVPDGKMEKIIKFGRDHGIKAIKWLNGEDEALMVQYAFELHQYDMVDETGEVISCWHTDYWLVYCPGDLKDYLSEQGMSYAFASQIDGNWYMVKNGNVGPWYLRKHLSDQELENGIKTGDVKLW